MYCQCYCLCILTFPYGLSVVKEFTNYDLMSYLFVELMHLHFLMSFFAYLKGSILQMCVEHRGHMPYWSDLATALRFMVTFGV